MYGSGTLVRHVSTFTLAKSFLFILPLLLLLLLLFLLLVPFSFCSLPET